MQSWLFARLIEAFQFSGQQLQEARNFWALMFFVLALGVGACYFTLGVTTQALSTVGAPSGSLFLLIWKTHWVKYVGATYRKDYFASLLRKPVSYYECDENASGTLVSRLSLDPKQLQELLGPMGVFPLVSFFNVLGSVAISFSFGWKLAAVTFFGSLPFIFLAAFLRIRYEVHFEAMNAEVYAESSKFIVEAIRAFRTVTALTMENQIIGRYSSLLRDQRSKAIRKALYATLVFAFSDSIELCAMALAFWYRPPLSFRCSRRIPIPTSSPESLLKG